MSEINFKPIFDYIDDKIDGLKEEMATKKDIERVLDAVAAFGNQTKGNEDKSIVLEEKTGRIEKWVIQAAEKVEVPYNP